MECESMQKEVNRVVVVVLFCVRAKGQVTSDFFVACVAVMLLLSTIFFMLVQKTDALRRVESELAAKRVAENLAGEINEVLSEGSGASASMRLMLLATGENYSVKTSGRLVEITWPIGAVNRTIAVPILTNATVMKEKNAGVEARVVNEGGVILID